MKARVYQGRQLFRTICVEYSLIDIETVELLAVRPGHLFA
jgi:hypothetical protein